MPYERLDQICAYFLPVAAGAVGLLPLSATALTAESSNLPKNSNQIISGYQSLPDLGDGSLNDSDTKKKLAALAKQLTERWPA